MDNDLKRITKKLDVTDEDKRLVKKFGARHGHKIDVNTFTKMQDMTVAEGGRFVLGGVCYYCWKSVIILIDGNEHHYANCENCPILHSML